MIVPSPRVPAVGHAPEIELCLKESETSGSQSIVFLILFGLRSITFFKAQPDSDLPDGASGIRRRLLPGPQGPAPRPVRPVLDSGCPRGPFETPGSSRTTFSSREFI